jgi:signal peptidase II
VIERVKVLRYAALVLVADQLTKVLARHLLPRDHSVPLVGDLVRLTYVENPGIAFGIRVGHGPVFTVLIAVASIVVLVYLLRAHAVSNIERVALAITFGGALGNLTDRVLFGRVVDFVDVDFPDFLMARWPVFNVADAAVTIGVIVLILMILLSSERGGHRQTSEQLSA